MNVKHDVIASLELRQKVIGRVHVLEKVKKLSMLPGDIYVTVEMASNYFEVSQEVIRQVIVRHRGEISSDGMKVIAGPELSELKSLSGIRSKAPKLTLLNRRNLLRIAMLLEVSEVAEKVRSYLLDKEEEVKRVQTAIPDVTGLSPLLQTLIQMETRQNAIETRQTAIESNQESITSTIQTIQETILTHDKNWRKSITSMMNAAVYRLGTNHADLRNKSYEMLEERGHCNLKLRLSRWHERLEKQGHQKSKIDEVKRIDVIEIDDKLKEIYTIIVKEISIGSLKLVGGK